MWIIFAISASVLWGLTYSFQDKILKSISIPTSLMITCFFTFIAMLFMSFFSKTLKPDLLAIASSRKLLFFVIAGTVAFILAELLIGLSIKSKNATLSGLIEISYPIFIAIFTFLFFKENQISQGTILGGALIFSGIFVIYFFNK